MVFFFALFLALCSAVPYLQIVEWQNQHDNDCPNFGNGGDGSAVNFASARVYEINNRTYKKRDEMQGLAADCVVYFDSQGNRIELGINEFNTSIATKVGHSLGFSYFRDGVSNITITEYNSQNCTIGTATGRVLVRNFYFCYENTENGVPMSRWFQLTPRIPSGYGEIGAPPSFFNLNYHLTDPITQGCGIRVKTLTFPNNQRCQQVASNLWVKAYCGSAVSFQGSYFTSSDCTTGEISFGAVNVGQCYNDNNIGQGCLNGVCFPSVATKVIFTCSSSALMFNFAGLVALLFLVVSLL